MLSEIEHIHRPSALMTVSLTFGVFTRRVNRPSFAQTDNDFIYTRGKGP